MHWYYWFKREFANYLQFFILQFCWIFMQIILLYYERNFTRATQFIVLKSNILKLQSFWLHINIYICFVYLYVYIYCLSIISNEIGISYTILCWFKYLIKKLNKTSLHYVCTYEKSDIFKRLTNEQNEKNGLLSL